MPSKKKKASKSLLGQAVAQVIGALANKHQTVKAQPSQNKKKKKKVRAQGVRALNAGMLTASKMDFHSTRNGVVCAGVELSSKILASQYSQTGSLPLRIDTGSSLLKRVSAFASVFQRYRFKHITLRYRSAAPATRSGLIAFAVSQSFDEEAPMEPTAFAAFENSLVTPVSTDAVSKTYRYDGNEWWDTDYSQFSVDPSKVIQLGLHGYVGDAASADTALIAGFLELVYEIEFEGLRPVRPTRYVGTAEADYANSAGSYQVARLNTPIAGDIGMLKTQNNMFAETESKEELGTILCDGAKILYQLYQTWGAAAVDAQPIDPRARPRRTIGRDHFCYKSRAEALVGELRDEQFAPTAAGDIVITAYSVLNGVTATIFTATAANGTGATSYNTTRDYQTTPGESIYFKWAPTGSEIRTLDASASFVDITVIGDENFNI